MKKLKNITQEQIAKIGIACMILLLVLIAFKASSQCCGSQYWKDWRTCVESNYTDSQLDYCDRMFNAYHNISNIDSVLLLHNQYDTVLINGYIYFDL